MLATPEKIIKIYVHIKRLGHFNHTFIERKHKNDSVLPVYKIKKNSNFYHIKIAISLDLMKILL